MPLDQYSEEQEEATMSFLDHLEQLRWHLIRSTLAVVIFSVAAFVSKDIVFHYIILAPTRTDFITYELLCKLSHYIGTDAMCIEKLDFTLQSRTMTGQFTMHITSSVVIGLICAFPYFFWEIWRFIAPGLHKKERNMAEGLIFFVAFLFFVGIGFGYYVISPMSIQFLAGYQLDPSIVNQFDIVSYISTVSMLVLSSGIMFEMPIVIYFTSKIGLTSPDFLRNYRRQAVVIILLVAAIITPPDVISQILISIPLFLLYEVSIFISYLVYKKKIKEAENGN
jgi:sec-independent protein translocase protein TatC